MRNIIHYLFTAAAIIFVGCEGPVNVIDVRVSPTAISLNTGESQTLLLSIKPSDADNRAVSWSSDASEVATVSDSGEVTAVGPGFATIIATTVDGGYTATCTVTVNNPEVVVTSGTVGDFTWELTNRGTLTISGEGAMPDFYDYNYTGLSWSEYAEAIETVVIADGVTDIGNGAFSRCPGLMSIDIPDSVTSIGNYAFNSCRVLTSIVIPNSVTSIGIYAFEYCTGLTSIDIPDSVTSIENGAFYGCAGLKSIDIPDSVTSIGGAAFSYCTGLTSIEIPDSVTSIGGSAFVGTSLTSIVIPDSVTSIGGSAFWYCTGLKDVTIMSATPPTLGNGNFSASDDTLHVPQGSLAAYENAPAWRAAFTNIIEQQ